MSSTEKTTLTDLTNPGAATDFFQRRKMDDFIIDSAFHVENAVWLMEMSRLVYRHEAPEANPPNPPRSQFLANVGFQQLNFFQDPATSTEAFLVRNEKFAVLAFRGTEPDGPKDIITDILFKTGDDDVHEGFDKAFKSVWPAIEPALNALDCPFYYTGHSLGAALATIATSKKRPTATYTFGSPRVGKKKFVDSLQGADIYRVVDDLDEVTALPPQAFGFAHVGTLHKLKEVPPPPRLVRDTWKHLADHAPINYVDRL